MSEQTTVAHAVQVAPARFVTIELAAAITGLSSQEIRRHIDSGLWPDGDVVRRRQDGTIEVSIPRFEAWVLGEVKPRCVPGKSAPKVRRGPTALYRHFDVSGALLYVGISLSAISRLSDHANASGWAAEIATVTVQWLPTRDAAIAAEREAIKSEQPRHNVVHNRQER